jgi:hypothetical protein
MIEVHVEGRIETGHLHEFVTGVERYRRYLRSNGYVVPEVLHGLSGQMNAILLIFRYDDVTAYEQHQASSMSDPAYAEAAGAMRFVDGTLHYRLYHPLD